jgi:type II secretory pathway predicted ATPase ExeA
MVLDFFHLREQPFGVTPDPRFWFASATHREALATLLYGLEAERGFVALLANPGMGKTTLLFNGLQRVGDRVKTVFIFQRVTNAKSLLQAVLADLGVTETRGSLIELQRKLNEICAEQARSGKRIVVVIDEAQNLDESVLEFVRMLSNFETSSRKLIQIVLAGQLQLAEKMASPSMTQLRQRISIFAHLRPLSGSETAGYIDHRLRTAGYSSNSPLFTPSAIELIAKHSQGIPRNINNLCFNAMSIGFALKKRTIDGDALREVIADLSLEPFTNQAVETPQPPLAEKAPDLQSEPAKKAPPARVRPTLQEVMLDLDRRLSGRKRSIVSRPSICETAADPGQQSMSIGSTGIVESGKGSSQPSRFLIPALAGGARYRVRILPGSIFRSAGAGVLMTMLICSLIMVILKRDGVDAAANPARSTVSSPIVRETSPTPDPSLAQAQPRIANSVVVRAGQSLESICAENYVNCNSDLLKKIRELNPEIRSADHVDAGQEIRLPSTTKADPSAEMADSN